MNFKNARVNAISPMMFDFLKPYSNNIANLGALKSLNFVKITFRYFDIVFLKLILNIFYLNILLFSFISFHVCENPRVECLKGETIISLNLDLKKGSAILWIWFDDLNFISKVQSKHNSTLLKNAKCREKNIWHSGGNCPRGGVSRARLEVWSHIR